MQYTLFVRSAMIASGVLLLVGCATQAQRQFQALKTSNQENNAEHKASYPTSITRQIMPRSKNMFLSMH